MFRCALLVTVVLSALFVGCSSDSSEPEISPGSEGWPCPNDNNCLDGRLCIDGACRTVDGDVGPRRDADTPDAPGLDAAIDGGIAPDTGVEDAGDPCPTPATLTAIQNTVFGPNGQAHCNQGNCHGQAQAGALSLLPGPNLHADLLSETRNAQAPERNIVVPGSPETSRLYVIMRDRMPAGGGSPMPPAQPVPFCDLEIVRRWIADGALDN